MSIRTTTKKVNFERDRPFFVILVQGAAIMTAINFAPTKEQAMQEIRERNPSFGSFYAIEILLEEAVNLGKYAKYKLDF
jgi:hypothetical protein